MTGAGRIASFARNAAAFAAAAAAGYLLEATGIVNPYWIQIFQLACIMSISALGLNLIYGFTGLFSLGHAAFYGIGAYTAACVMKSAGGESQAVFLVSLAAGTAGAAAVALLVGLPVLRLTSDYLGIATLGFGIIMKVLFDNADSFLPMAGGARGMTGIAKMTNAAWCVASLWIVAVAVRNLVRSGFGRALVSIREDEIAAESVGIDTFLYKLAGFVAGCGLAGMAGGLYAHLYTFLHPGNFDFFKSVDVLVIVVLGGLGNISGTLVASFGWIFLLEVLRVVLPSEFIEFRWVLIPVLLIVTMLLRPQGLFGFREFRFFRDGTEG
ncbi:MAG: branched-chain amino acid ABC transporter permease [Deltaproteobacteria bacterium]|nr:branched-chain amino acid ABC transporter permease [Deltaproteobacteria bacterium]